ncbi:hypothetical protein EPT53_10355, partial [Fusobacterium necrophorum]
MCFISRKYCMMERFVSHRDSVREGVYKSYYANGQLEIIKNYKNGNLHGSYETFYNDGKISSR